MRKPVIMLECRFPLFYCTGIDVLKARRDSVPDLGLHLACLALSLAVWSATVLTLRYTIKLLLSYKGWMYEARKGGISLKTKIWGMLLKTLVGGPPHRLYDFQGSLPRIPLPALDYTINKYLESMKPLLSEEEYRTRQELAQEFQSSALGRKCQWYLWLKSWWSTNYVTDWWEEYVYLRGRDPLLINSNYYGIDALALQSNRQASRAAYLLYATFQYRRSIDSQSLPPLLIQNMIPLCSRQYERMFNTTRIPGVETDRLDHFEQSNYVVVLCRGCYYVLEMYSHTRLLTPPEIEAQVEWILAQTPQPDPGEDKLAALTTAERKRWAVSRRKYFGQGLNRASLRTIEKAAFVVVLEDRSYELDPSNPAKFDEYVQSLFYGTGCDRWLDKSFNFIVGANGRVGLNVEHSWADAPVMAQFWEVILTHELCQNVYTPEGRINASITDKLPPTPKKLQWELSPEALEEVEACVQLASRSCKDIDLRLYVHQEYGKHFVKQCRVSPDAFIQMALQLAYYRDAGHFALTYEASMTRLFREGRTETVRTVTEESCAWVRAMDDPDKTDDEKRELLRDACRIHQDAYLASMCGYGIDRHLFCLYVVSKYLRQDSPFLDSIFKDKWRLSTSQTPHNQAYWMDARKYADHICGGGGFGPTGTGCVQVADDGYGVSYLVTGEHMVFFHVSSKHSSPKTDTTRFVEHIKRALRDLRNLFPETIAK
ncbi:CPT1A [Cordylochernes scorpioides]|uniref:CPT1A n=1 Tax=Cordylochernes scorpioides TaxID=51811 RepID=A0ABY6LA17_9ARAC|nr:CPT1A [Cordylochernes scorpioides]